MVAHGAQQAPRGAMLPTTNAVGVFGDALAVSKATGIIKQVDSNPRCPVAHAGGPVVVDLVLWGHWAPPSVAPAPGLVLRNTVAVAAAPAPGACIHSGGA